MTAFMTLAASIKSDSVCVGDGFCVDDGSCGLNGFYKR